MAGQTHSNKLKSPRGSNRADGSLDGQHDLACIVEALREIFARKDNLSQKINAMAIAPLQSP
jgi:hypothetical protein